MKRILGALVAFLTLASTLFAVHLGRLPHGDLVVDFLDIGQGDAILITTPDQHHILVDGGPQQGVLEELGEVLPFLHRQIDWLVLTHPHEDHMMGLVQVLRRYEVKAVLFSGLNYKNSTYEAFLKEIRQQGIPLTVAKAHEDWQLGEVKFDVLYPIHSMIGKTMNNVNNGSVVMKVTYGSHRLLLTGDAELEEESEMLQTNLDFEADILKVGHHGSRTSSTEAFLDRIKPKIAVIQSGKNNEFKHPHPETLEKLAERNILVQRNDLQGRVRIILSKSLPPTVSRFHPIVHSLDQCSGCR